MQTPSVFHGVDVDKDELIIGRADQKSVVTVHNTRPAIRAWLKSIPADAVIGVEPTNRYHLTLVDLAHRLQRTSFVLDARRTRAHARAMGYRGKTDRTDALSIARFVAATWSELRPYQPPTPNQRHLDALLRRRGKLTTVRTQLAQMGRALPGLGNQLRSVIAQIGQLIDQVTHQMGQLSRQDPQQADLMRRLDAIPSVGAVTAIGLANLFRRVPLDSADRAIAFVGLDPRPCDSGKRRGRRKLTKHGPAELRRLLYLAAMSASKIKLWKPFYQRDRQRGLETTEALVILARRLLRTAWAIAFRNVEFDPRRVGVARPAP
jgi:transposase